MLVRELVALINPSGLLYRVTLPLENEPLAECFNTGKER